MKIYPCLLVLLMGGEVNRLCGGSQCIFVIFYWCCSKRTKCKLRQWLFQERDWYQNTSVRQMICLNRTTYRTPTSLECVLVFIPVGFFALISIFHVFCLGRFFVWDGTRKQHSDICLHSFISFFSPVVFIIFNFT